MVAGQRHVTSFMDPTSRQRDANSSCIEDELWGICSGQSEQYQAVTATKTQRPDCCHRWSDLLEIRR
jgi:hypothetical protein